MDVLASEARQAVGTNPSVGNCGTRRAVHALAVWAAQLSSTGNNHRPTKPRAGWGAGGREMEITQC